MFSIHSPSATVSRAGLHAHQHASHYDFWTTFVLSPAWSLSSSESNTFFPGVIYNIPWAAPLDLADFYFWLTISFSSSTFVLILADFGIELDHLLNTGLSVHSAPLPKT